MTNQKIGIIGIGMVGGALAKYFKNKTEHELYLYDKEKEEGSIEDINKADYIYICVPTPCDDKEMCDTSIVEEAINYLKGNKIIIIKSTVSPGTIVEIQYKYQQHKILFNPEFLTESTADQDMQFPDRQILGYTKQSYNVAEEVMLQLPLAPLERIVPSYVAEFIKYGGNTWFAVKVAKNNELYDLTKKFGLSDDEFEMVTDGMSADKRIGRTHLQIYHKGYRGYNGKCLPKDAKALLAFAEQLNIDMPVLKAANKYNDDLLKKQTSSECDNCNL